MSNFSQGRGKEGVARRRTEARRTSNPAVWRRFSRRSQKSYYGQDGDCGKELFM